MELDKITIDPVLLTFVAQTLGRVPENLYDFQKIKNLACSGKPVYQKLIDPLHDPIPERLQIVRGDFSIIGKMSRLKKLTISAMQVNDFSFLKTCTALESLEISACGVIDCACLKDITTLKSLSLLHCSELAHVEDILKLFRLERLSLEGSAITDASCFMNCRIKEVHLPENCLKAKQTKEKDMSKAKKTKTAVRSCKGVPFRALKRERSQHPYTLQEFASPLWEVYRGAYGNVMDYLAILVGERDEAPETFRLRRLDNAPKSNYEMAFDNLCENLWHQMSFYPATWLAVPYLARLMEKWEREEIEFGYFDPDERIEKTAVPAEKWDGQSFTDKKLWLFNLFGLLGDTEGIERLCYYFGTYTCPECGEQTEVIQGMEGYFLS